MEPRRHAAGRSLEQPGAHCCDLFDCRSGDDGALAQVCLTELEPPDGATPEIRVDLPEGDDVAGALRLSVAPLRPNGGLVVQLRPGDRRDRRRRTDPHRPAGPRLRIRALGRTEVLADETAMGGGGSPSAPARCSSTSCPSARGRCCSTRSPTRCGPTAATPRRAMSGTRCTGSGGASSPRAPTAPSRPSSSPARARTRSPTTTSSSTPTSSRTSSAPASRRSSPTRGAATRCSSARSTCIAATSSPTSRTPSGRSTSAAASATSRRACCTRSRRSTSRRTT